MPFNNSKRGRKTELDILAVISSKVPVMNATCRGRNQTFAFEKPKVNIFLGHCNYQVQKTSERESEQRQPGGGRVLSVGGWTEAAVFQVEAKKRS